MLTIELINNTIPRLHLQDKVSKALQLITDFSLTHLPVVADEKYLGLVGEDELIEANEKTLIELLQDVFILPAVKNNEHFLTALNFCNLHNTSIIPVINEKKDLMGVITTPDLLKALGNFTGTNEIGGIIVLEMERSQFAISEISRIVESNDATILHLNTMVNAITGLLTVSIHTNKKEIAAIVAHFERYDYNIIYYFGSQNFQNEIHTNYRHLMNYLDI